MQLQFLLFLFLCLFTPGCKSKFTVPDTLGDPSNAPSYGYTPLDPLPVIVKIPAGQARPTTQTLLDLMPDETMRLAIGRVDGSGSITFGPASAGVAGSSYVVVLDYIKCDTSQVGLKKTERAEGAAEYSLATSGNTPDIILPVYVGVGLRLTANVRIVEGSVDLANLLAIGAAVKSKRASGTLVIQTLGLTGEGVSTAIPIPSELNETTIQNALIAMGAVKAKTYHEKTLVTPRVVGVYNSVGGGQETVNGLVSTLLERPIELYLPLPPAPGPVPAPAPAPAPGPSTN
jgi:hypothetical protein